MTDDAAKFGTPAFYAAIGRAFVAMCGVVPVLAIIEFADQRLDGALDLRLAIRPHELSGLGGVVFAPFVHSGWDHLLANSSPLILLGTFALAAGTRSFLIATAVIAVFSGLMVWFFTPPGYLVLGASGIAFGWLGLLFMRGLIERSWWHLGVAMLVGLLYGWQLALLVPTDEAISWQGHLGGFVGGGLAAVVTHARSARPATGAVSLSEGSAD